MVNKPKNVKRSTKKIKPVSVRPKTKKKVAAPKRVSKKAEAAQPTIKTAKNNKDIFLCIKWVFKLLDATSFVFLRLKFYFLTKFNRIDWYWSFYFRRLDLEAFLFCQIISLVHLQLFPVALKHKFDLLSSLCSRN